MHMHIAQAPPTFDLVLPAPITQWLAKKIPYVEHSACIEICHNLLAVTKKIYFQALIIESIILILLTL